MELLDVSLLDWSRLQFTITAMYHWIFVPLTLGLGVIQAIMETIYYRTGDEKWKKATKFWMVLFGINFAIGVATGIIMEFQFGTNWSNYSWFVGDIFGAPLAIEGIVAFFMEATFISIMFFGWNKVSKGFHLASTWLTIIGATLSALWILVANAWMQNPVGMEFNPETVRNEMVDFWALLSPFALNKFLHTVWSSWVVGALFVLGVSSWYLIKNKNVDFAKKSIRVASVFGLVAALLTAVSGDGSGYNVAQKQPMKLAAIEGLYEGEHGAGLVAVGVLNPNKNSFNDNVDPFLFKFEIPNALSLLSFRDAQAYVPGINNIIAGGYQTPEGTIALSFDEKREKGKMALGALTNFKAAQKANDSVAAALHKDTLMANYDYFGYGYLDKPEETIPHVPILFYSFRIMVGLGTYFILLFLLFSFFSFKKDMYFERFKWLLWVAVFTIPLGFIASQLGWVVAEVGRQPWAIQDILPIKIALSSLSATSVMITVVVFSAIFTALLIAEIRIMYKQIKKGPEE